MAESRAPGAEADSKAALSTRHLPSRSLRVTRIARSLFRARVRFMKQKINVHLDADILQLAKQRAAEERRPLGELIKEALANYLRKFTATSEERKMAYELFCERPMRLSDEQLQQVLEEDVWDP
jgi:hypothetical protein